MPTYEITSPDGKTYEVGVPEGVTQEDVLSHFQSNFAAPEQPSFAEENRKPLRAAKNVTAGVLGRTADVSPLGLGLIGSQIAARVPGWITQGMGSALGAAGDVTNIDKLKELGDIGQMAGEMANRDVSNYTQKATGMPFFSAMGGANAAIETLVPETAPRNIQEAGNDAFWQVMTGGAGKGIGRNLGTAIGAAGTEKSVETGNPLWALGSMALPFATSYAAGKVYSKTPMGQITQAGYRPDVYPEEVGKNVAQDISGAKQALGYTYDDIAANIGNTSAQLPQGYTSQLADKLGLNFLHEPTLKRFNQSVRDMLIKNSAAGKPYLSRDDIMSLKEQYREAADSTSTAAARTIGRNPNEGIRGVLKEAEMNQANAAGEAVRLAKTNRDYALLTDFEKKFIESAGPQASKISDKMHAAFLDDPVFYSQEFAKLSPAVQKEVVAHHMKQLGGGNVFDPKKWGESVIALDPKSRLLLAGNDPAMAEKLLKLAQNTKDTHKFLNLASKGLNLAAYTTGGLPGLLASRMLINPRAVNALTGLNRIGDKNFPIAKGRLMNQLTTLMQEEATNDDYSTLTNPQPSEPVTPPVAPEREVPDLPLYNQKQEAGQGDYLKTLAQVENAGRETPDKNPNSSATGKYQITDGTWKGLQNKYPQFRNKDKNDPAVQEEATLVLQQESDDAITAAGLTPDDDTRSFVHFLGETNARKLLPKMNSRISAARLAPEAAKSNPEYFYEKLPNGKRGRARTPKEVFEYRKMKMSNAKQEIKVARR